MTHLFECLQWAQSNVWSAKWEQNQRTNKALSPREADKARELIRDIESMLEKENAT